MAAFLVPASGAGERLDHFLATQLPALSRSQIQRLIRAGHVRVAPGRAKPGLIVAAGMTIDVEVPRPVPAAPQPEALPLEILYDDPDLVIINKPAGLVVHPAAGHPGGTLVNALLHHVRDLSGIGGVARPGIVHRLDRGTSGVMVVAKHDAAHRELARQFHDREVEKEYVALVWGAPCAGVTLDQPIGRDRRLRKKISSRSDRARTALTTIVSVEALRGVSLVRVRIGTGRTHQIRVHLSEIGHPIVGDATYGGRKPRLPADLAALSTLSRPFLHAQRLAVTHPRTGERLSFEAPLPSDLREVLTQLRGPSSRI
jgi:23S rRNA pseudouridine1911/1915/1917 synthase